MKSFVIVLLFFLFGCSTPSKFSNRVEIDNGIEVQLPSPVRLMKSAKILQLITFEFNGEKKTVQCLLHNQNDELKVVGISPVGNELFHIDYDGHSIEFSENVPEKMRKILKFMLVDIFLIYSDEEEILRATDSKMKMEEKKLTRAFFVNGKKLISVDYSNVDRLLSDVKYTNFTKNYHLSIKRVGEFQ